MPASSGEGFGYGGRRERRAGRLSRALLIIKISEPLAKNQVYVEPGDYDFVFNCIVSRRPNAAVKG